MSGMLTFSRARMEYPSQSGVSYVAPRPSHKHIHTFVCVYIYIHIYMYVFSYIFIYAYSNYIDVGR